jgi:hypothetical protein
MVAQIQQNKETHINGVIQSLLYLYQEALRENIQELTRIIQVAIESCGQIKNTLALPQNSENILKQYYVLREFQKLDDAQKEQFIQKIECLQTEGLEIKKCI